MQRVRLEETREPFACPVAGRAVYIHRIWKVLQDFRGEDKGRICARTTCEYQNHCVIASYTAAGVTYDWDKCALVQSTKSKSA